MADYRIIAKEQRDSANRTRAHIELIRSGSALRRAGEAGLRVLRGEEPIPRNLEEVKDLLQNSIFGKRPDRYDYLSRFGTPVRNYIKINDGAYDVLDGSGQVVKRRYQGIFLDSAIIDVQLPKNIVLTSINGRDGTRKEFVSNGDFRISIAGEIASDHPEIYPATQVALLRDIVKSPEPLSVICPHLMTFGINTIVVTEAEFPQQRGVYNVQRFSISAVSHLPQDIFIEEVTRQEEAAKGRIGQFIDQVDERYQQMYQRIDQALGQVPTENGVQEGA